MTKVQASALREKDLFGPIARFFEEQGFDCDGEVAGMDLYMEKDGLTAAVELKLKLDFRALQQAALRQKTADNVYIGIPRPAELFSHAFRDKLYLLKRLGIGLVCVSPRTGKAELVSEPVEARLEDFRKRNRKKRQKIREEFGKRRLRCNTGGVRGVPLMTGYRENALLVLWALGQLGGEGSTREIRALCGVQSATAILYRDPYGWFSSSGRGRYRVTPAGIAAADTYSGPIFELAASLTNAECTSCPPEGSPEGAGKQEK